MAADPRRVDGIFSLWSEPRRARWPRHSQLELVLLPLSVLEWRRWNGRAILFCDSRYARYLEGAGLLGLWDEVDTETIEKANLLDVNPDTFWSTGRLTAIAAAAIPFASVDCDLIAWRPLGREFAPGEIAFTHWESAQISPWYPDPVDLLAPDGYQIDTRRDWSLKAANVSLTYFGSVTVRDAYVSEALRFITGNPAVPVPSLGVAPELLFAEQRLLPVIAAEHGVPARPLMAATWVPNLHRFIDGDARFGALKLLQASSQCAGITHVWFFKKLLVSESGVLPRLLSDLTGKLRSDYPEAAEALARSGII